MSKENGGPAFPVLDWITPDKQAYKSQGMTLRDYFAAKAMQAILARYGYQRGCIDEAAINAYDCADAMLAEREK